MVDNRSEIVFVYDAQKTNPNGNPMSSDNSPRIDRKTGEAVVTDVRLKRYIRDQLTQNDDYSVYLANTDVSRTRGSLASRVFPDDLEDRLRGEEIEGEEIRETFLENAVDVRLFGATLSFSGDGDEVQELLEEMPSSYTGPVQFMPAISLNSPVQLNEESDSLTSIVATGDDKEQGGYDLDDKRVQYAIFPFYGVVNEEAASDTNLSEDDVRMLDSTLWKSIKNQTITRSKIGQEPRLYMRVEHEQDSYQIGDLHNMISFNHSEMPPEDSIRRSGDVNLDVTDVLDTLIEERTRIKKLHVKGSNNIDYTFRDSNYTQFGELLDDFRSEVHSFQIRQVRPLSDRR